MNDVALDMESLLETFFEEAEEHLATLEHGLLALETAPDDREVIGSIFRAAHSIKGASGTFGFADVASFTHALETVLDRLRSADLACDAAVAKVLLEALDVLQALVRCARDGSAAPASAAAVRASLEGLLGHPGPQAPAAAPVAHADERRTVEVVFRPKREIMTRALDPLQLLREVADSGELLACEMDVSALPDIAEMDAECMYLAWRVVVRTTASDADLRDVFMFVDDLCALDVRAPARAPAPAPAPRAAAPAPAPRAPAPAPAPAPAHAATIRVATDKVDKLLDLVGEIVIAQAMIAEAVRAPREDAATRLNDALGALDRHTRDLQERVMSIRMVPLGTVFGRLPRMVRDLAAAVRKDVRLAVEGEGTEIDKSMVEQLVDPLTHLVRNAIDHGLEPADERRDAGKPEQGTVLLRAFHQGGNVVIEVSDDGRGLPTDKIRAKAERLGLLPKGVSVSDDEIHELIFHPGFSTAAQVSDISGRGVGMDVVKRNVEALNGSLQVSTGSGRGTCMRLRLPLTLAILDGLAVRVGSQTFIVPLLSVAESFRPTRAQVRSIRGSADVIDVRNTSLPIARLHAMLDVPDAEHDPCAALVCVVETNGSRVALLVDEVLGQMQVVVKSLETNFRKIDALMGATILGDGRVAMIVDTQALSRSASSGPAPERSSRATAHATETA